jgi:type II secretory pathway pseudopilin PulG
MTRARQEAGFTVIELAVAATISLVVFGATLTALTSLVRQRNLAEKQTVVATQARQGIDRLARQLRNLASPADIITNVTASTQPKSVDRNLPNDLIFKDVGDVRPTSSLNSANVRRIRYCLQTSGTLPDGTAASPSRAIVWMQTQTWTTALPPAMPATNDCPGTGWPTQVIVSEHVTNAAATPPRELFRYSGDLGQVTATTPEARETISRVEATVIVDEDPVRAPEAIGLTSSVILRNQNRAPAARFTYTLLNPVTCSIQLNGSASEDPESKPLKYEWWIDGVKQPEGVVIQKSVPIGTHVYELKVSDRAGLSGIYTETHSCPVDT